MKVSACLAMASLLLALGACSSDDDDTPEGAADAGGFGAETGSYSGLCSGDGSGGGLATDNENVVDITNSILVESSPNCADYVNRYIASATDVTLGVVYTGNLQIAIDGNSCAFSSNAIPNHDFNDDPDGSQGGVELPAQERAASGRTRWARWCP